MYTIGYDIGSSSIKAALVETVSGKPLAVINEPKKEMPIIAVKNGWAEQHPNDWWQHLCKATKVLLRQTAVSADQITGIGISYQMHGLVIIDQEGKPLRPAIIWCDSRAVDIGEQAFATIGEEKCTAHALNSPANFTASKLRWVQENEPEIYAKIYKCMLPGDYIAYQLTNTLCTTISGLSEGVFWDFKAHATATWLLDYFDIDPKFIPEITPTFSQQGVVSKAGAEASGLAPGTPLYYRAGDQPNNALALNVFNPGEVAVTGGTSGVVYAITQSTSVKESARVNNFAHVNYSVKNPIMGKLLCINGAGIQYRWLMDNLAVNNYQEMNRLATTVPIGSDGVTVHPFGNGAERMLNNKSLGTKIGNLNLNNHNKAHLCRATLEGIAFSFVYGIEIMKADAIVPKVIRAGNDNLFRSAVFSETIATLIDQDIEIYNTTGAIGAARACQLHLGDFEAFGAHIMEHDFVMTYSPKKEKQAYTKAYQQWKKELELILKNN